MEASISLPSRRSWLVVSAVLSIAVVTTLAQPSPPEARANVACDVGTGPVGAVTGAVGLGNPAGDVCNEVSGAVEAVAGGVGGAITSPVTGALKGLGNDVFRQLTGWVAEGAGWLTGKVVTAIDSSTSPNLETEGFLRSYGRMAAIAAVMACAMFLLAILEGIAQGSPGLLLRVLLVNMPVAFLGTSLAFTVVQLLLGVTDGLSAAIANATHHDSTRFFEAAIVDLGKVGGEAGKQIGTAGGASPTTGADSQAGAVAVPLFVGFVAAIVAAFAAFFVWLELWMREAAVYAVSLFMPLVLAASIWPRWTGVLRKTSEILIALIGSKFVMVSILSLAASLVAGDEGSGAQALLAAAALMCLDCFAPFVLLRLIPFSEGALGAAYGRRAAAAGATTSAARTVSNVQMVRRMGGSDGGSGVSLWGPGEGGGSGRRGGPQGSGPGPSRPGDGKGGRGDRGGSGAAASTGRGSGAASGASVAQGAGSGVGATAAVPATVGKGARQASDRLSSTAAARGAGASSADAGADRSDGKPRASTPGQDPGSTKAPRPRPDSPPQADAVEAGDSSRGRDERPPRPSPESPPQKEDRR